MAGRVTEMSPQALILVKFEPHIGRLFADERTFQELTLILIYMKVLGGLSSGAKRKICDMNVRQRFFTMLRSVQNNNLRARIY